MHDGHLSIIIRKRTSAIFAGRRFLFVIDQLGSGVKAMRNIVLAASLSALLFPATAFADNDTVRLSEPFQIADSAAVQQQRAQPAVLPAPQRFALTIGGLYTHREGETAGWAPSVMVDYAATNRLQLHAMVPMAYDRVSGGSTHFGVGDVETGIRYRFLDDDPTGWRPSVAVYPLVDFPTGNANENLGTGRAHYFLPLWFAKSFGPWIPYAGGGYWINPGPNNRNWFFGTVGTLRELSEKWTVFGEVFHATSSKVGLKAQTGFDVGARFNLTTHHHFLFTIGTGLQNASQTNQITSYLAYVMTF